MGVLGSERRRAPVQVARPEGSTPDAESLAPADGTQLAWELARTLIQPALKVGSTDDPLERDAEQFAGFCCASQAGGGSPCAECQQKAKEPSVQRKTRSPGRPPDGGVVRGLALGQGRPLGAAQRAFFEPRAGGDLGAVRIHTDSHAGRAAERLDARAFTVRHNIAFGPAEYRPETDEGQRLLAHEIAHVIQQRTGGQDVLRCAPAEPESPVCAGPQAEAPVCKTAPGTEQLPPTPLPPVGSLDQRVDQFKSLVKVTAIHRLLSNQQNLAQWEHLVSQVIPAGDVSALGLAQGGGAGAYLEMQGIRDPLAREVRANQVMGRWRACTGCHMMNYVWGTRQEREALGGREWLTPAEQRSLPGGYRPAPGGTEQRVHQLFPNPKLAQQAMGRVRPILAALGPEGYQVLPGSILADLEFGQFESVRTNIGTAIAERSRDYGELIDRIRAGRVGYEHFGPIIRDLLTVTDPEVARAIQAEMDSHAFWSKVEAVMVGIMTVAALLLAIFPPTSPVGLAWLGSLELTLATYGVMKAPGMIETGQAYSLSTGAYNVLTREQQQAGAGLVLGGFLNVVLAPVGMASGLSRVPATPALIGEASVFALQSGETLQQGRYLVTMGEDGSLVAAVADQPDVLIIVRDGQATAYQLTGTGGLRVLETAPVLPAGAGGPGGGAGAPFEGSWPHVPQRAPNWCGPACGEMAAGRLGVEVPQEQIAAHGLFDPEFVAEGGQVVTSGGFQTEDLAAAMEEVAPVTGRTWIGGTFKHDISTPAALRETLQGFLKSSKASVILRVRGGRHFIVVDEVTADGLIAIRDPAAKTSALVTPDELLATNPVPQAVFSFPKTK